MDLPFCAQQRGSDRQKATSRVGFHSSKGHTGVRGDLAMGQAMARREYEHLPLLGTKALEGACGLLGFHEGVGAPGGIGEPGRGSLEELLGWGTPALRSLVIDEAAPGDHGHEPDLRGDRRIEAGGAPPQIQEDLLDRILGVGRLEAPHERPHDPPVAGETFAERNLIARGNPDQERSLRRGSAIRGQAGTPRSTRRACCKTDAELHAAGMHGHSHSKHRTTAHGPRSCVHRRMPRTARQPEGYKGVEPPPPTSRRDQSAARKATRSASSCAVNAKPSAAS